MDQSEFKPPVRLSMTDEEIYQALGNAQATEDGLAKAMAIVEEQANLREHDNQLHAEWVSRMQASEDPLAKIALENLERTQAGLEPLPLEVIEEVQETDVPVVVEVVEVVEIEVAIPEPVQADEEDAFDAILAQAANEATSAITVADNVEPVAVTFEAEPAVESPDEFETAADEDALVFEEAAAKTHRTGWGANVAFWFITLGVCVPVVIAYLVAVQEVSFGSAMSGFAIGMLAVLGLAISAHFTAQRTSEDFVVTKRATFGVFGASTPGLIALGLSFSLLILGIIGGVQSFDGVFQLGFRFGDHSFVNLSNDTIIELAVLLLLALVVGFAQRARRWINIGSGVFLFIGFVLAALSTRGQVSFSGIDLGVSASQTMTIAGFVALAGIIAYGRAPKVISNSKAKINTLGRWAALVATLVVIPSLVYAHFFLVFDQNLPANGFSLLGIFARVESPAIATAVLWVSALGVLAILLNLGFAVVEEIRSFAVNRLRPWFALVLFAGGSTALWFANSWGTWLSTSQLFLLGVSAAVGIQLADSLLRRGAYHESSLLRSYGFYGSVNVLSVLGFAAATTAGLSVALPVELFTWLGFSGLVTPFAPLIAFAFGFLWQLSTGYFRVKTQQLEVSEVEKRKASLSEFSGFSE